jgi:hypothetical protein
MGMADYDNAMQKASSLDIRITSFAALRRTKIVANSSLTMRDQNR